MHHSWSRCTHPGQLLSSCALYSSASGRILALRRQRPCRWVRVIPQASTAFEILFQNQSPYLLNSDTDSKPLRQLTTVVKFAGDHDEKAVAGATGLILDAKGNIHSLYREGQPVTGVIWDLLSVVSGLVDDGPIGLLGIGAGTVGHLIHAFWPEKKMVGWELDAELLPVVRAHMGLQQLEDSGALECHVGDALADSATVEGGFAALVVDLFGEGDILPQLQQVETWQKLKQRLRPGGRVIANCAQESRMAKAMLQVFEEVQFHGPLSPATANVTALTGPVVAEATWKTFPRELSHCTSGWGSFEALDKGVWR